MQSGPCQGFTTTSKSTEHGCRVQPAPIYTKLIPGCAIPASHPYLGSNFKKKQLYICTYNKKCNHLPCIERCSSSTITHNYVLLSRYFHRGKKPNPYRKKNYRKAEKPKEKAWPKTPRHSCSRNLEKTKIGYKTKRLRQPESSAKGNLKQGWRYNKNTQTFLELTLKL